MVFLLPHISFPLSSLYLVVCMRLQLAGYGSLVGYGCPPKVRRPSGIVWLLPELAPEYFQRLAIGLVGLLIKQMEVTMPILTGLLVIL